MAFYADGSGSIRFDRELNDDEIDALVDAFGDIFDADWYTSIADALSDCPISRTVIEFWTVDPIYRKEEVRVSLEHAANVGGIVDGSIDYVGENGELWRWVFKDNEWKTQQGHVVYDLEDEDRKASLFYGLVRAVYRHTRSPHEFEMALYCVGLTDDEVAECVRRMHE